MADKMLNEERNRGKNPWQVTLSFPRMQLRRMSENSMQTENSDESDSVPVSRGSLIASWIDDILHEKDEKINELARKLSELQQKYDAKCAQVETGPKPTGDGVKKLCTHCRKEVTSGCPITPPVCGIHCLDEFIKKTFPPEYWPDDMAVNVQASAQATAQAVPNSDEQRNMNLRANETASPDITADLSNLMSVENSLLMNDSTENQISVTELISVLEA